MAEIKTKLSPPWIIYVAKINALFQHDPEVHVSYLDETKEIIIRVDNIEKAEALTLLLPNMVEFGNTWIEIIVIPANYEPFKDEFDGSDYNTLFNVAFKNNPIFAFTYPIDGIFSNRLVYVVFKNRVVQFFADNLNDIHGNISTLYQDIAEEIFTKNNMKGVLFCTDIEEKVGKPLGEWP